MEVRKLAVEGTPIAYRVAGQGEPVVLVHGLSGSWRWWQPVLEPLAERRRVHVLDLPRLGTRLPAEELTRWLKGDVSPVVTGDGSIGGALTRGAQRLLVRIAGLPKLTLEARSETLNRDAGP